MEKCLTQLESLGKLDLVFLPCAAPEFLKLTGRIMLLYLYNYVIWTKTIVPKKASFSLLKIPFLYKLNGRALLMSATLTVSSGAILIARFSPFFHSHAIQLGDHENIIPPGLFAPAAAGSSRFNKCTFQAVSAIWRRLVIQ